MKKQARRFLTLALCIMLIACAFAVPGAAEVDKSQTLMIYSNSAADGKADWVTARAKEEGFNIECVSIDGGDLLNRLIAERNNQQADVIWGLNAMSYEQLKQENLLLQFEAPTWAADCDPGLGDPDGYYYPIVVQPLLLVYKTNVFAEGEAPTDWIEAITDEAFAGKINILALNGGTSQSLIAGMLIRYREDGAEHDISQEGWDVMRRYIQENHVNTPEEDWFANFTSDKFPITGLWGNGFIQRMNDMGVTDMDYAAPEIGVPYVVEQLAISSGSNKAELAQAFIEWFGSAEIQGEFSAQFGTAPACNSALDQALPEVKEMLERLHPQDIDWKFVGDHRDAWMEKIQLEFVQ